MINEKLKQAINDVYEELHNLSKADFLKELEQNRNKDIAKIILETNSLKVGEIESKLFGNYEDIYENELKIDSNEILSIYFKNSILIS